MEQSAFYSASRDNSNSFFTQHPKRNSLCFISEASQLVPTVQSQSYWESTYVLSRFCHPLVSKCSAGCDLWKRVGISFALQVWAAPQETHLKWKWMERLKGRKTTKSTINPPEPRGQVTDYENLNFVTNETARGRGTGSKTWQRNESMTSAEDSTSTAMEMPLSQQRNMFSYSDNWGLLM